MNLNEKNADGVEEKVSSKNEPKKEIGWLSCILARLMAIWDRRKHWLKQSTGMCFRRASEPSVSTFCIRQKTAKSD